PLSVVIPDCAAGPIHEASDPQAEDCPDPPPVYQLRAQCPLLSDTRIEIHLNQIRWPATQSDAPLAAHLTDQRRWFKPPSPSNQLSCVGPPWFHFDPLRLDNSSSRLPRYQHNFNRRVRSLSDRNAPGRRYEGTSHQANRPTQHASDPIPAARTAAAQQG